MLRATMPTNPAAIHSIVSMKRSIDARFMSAPNGFQVAGRRRRWDRPAAAIVLAEFYCASALYLVSDARSSAIAASGSVPVFLTVSAQLLTRGSEAFFHSAVCSGVSL